MTDLLQAAAEAVEENPKGWLVAGGRTFVDKCHTHKLHAETSQEARGDGAKVLPLHSDHTALIRDLAAEVVRLRADAASKSEYAIDRISMTDAIRVMNDLMLMVEGPFCVDWRNANGLRIKDTSEWALFYVKTVKMVRSLEEVEGKEAVQELFAKLRNAARTGDSHER